MSKAKEVKKLEKRAGELWKLVCLERDGQECMVKKHFPEIAIEHNGPLQVDHCITRKNKHLFFEPTNGTVVCASCNRAKHFKQKSIDRAIDDIVKQREGEDHFNFMVAVDQRMEPNLNWGKIEWLEMMIEKLEAILKKEKNDNTNANNPRIILPGSKECI